MVWIVAGLFVGACCVYNIWRAFVVAVDVILDRLFCDQRKEEENSTRKAILLALFLGLPIDVVSACIRWVMQRYSGHNEERHG